MSDPPATNAPVDPLLATEVLDEEVLVDLIGAHEFILHIWEKWDRDGKIRKFRIIPEKY